MVRRVHRGLRVYQVPPPEVPQPNNDSAIIAPAISAINFLILIFAPPLDRGFYRGISLFLYVIYLAAAVIARRVYLPAE